VYFEEVDSWQFPDKGWEDRLGSVLAMWLDVLSHTSIEVNERLSFMDGPYYVQIRGRDLQFMSRDGRVWHRVEAGIDDVRLAVLNAFAQIDRAYLAHGWPIDKDWQEARVGAAVVRRLVNES